MIHDDRPRGRGLRRRGERVGGVLQPRLLLQLAKQPAHGYELMEGLAQQEGQPPLDPGTMYRILRFFEEEGLVSSCWETAGGGPARRIYEVTDQGIEYLHMWVANVRAHRERLDRFLADYESYLATEQQGE